MSQMGKLHHVHRHAKDGVQDQKEIQTNRPNVKPSLLMPATKRLRTSISREELNKLEEMFEENHWPSKELKQMLCNELERDEKFINVWFQNRRARERKVDKLISAKRNNEECLGPNSGVTSLLTNKCSTAKDVTKPYVPVVSSGCNTASMPTLFKTIIDMISLAEGGIIQPTSPKFSSVSNDTIYGIQINKQKRLIYNSVYGLDLIPL